MTKVIYNYHSETFEFLNEGEADPSPLEAGEYLFPAFSTLVKPPQVKQYEVAVFDGIGWIIKVDWRSVTLYSTVDGSSIIINEIGVTPSDVVATDAKRPSPVHSWNVKKQMWELDKVKQTEFNASALATAKAEAIAASIKYADDLQASILGSTSAAAQARLDNKYTAACAIKDGTATAGDKAVIETEVATRPKYTEAQLVNVIIAKGTVAKKAEGLINGMLLLAQDAIEAATTLPALDAAIKAIMTKADALKAQLLAGLQED